MLLKILNLRKVDLVFFITWDIFTNCIINIDRLILITKIWHIESTSLQ